MTTTYNTVKEIYGRNYGSERLFKRSYYSNLLYTEGVKDFGDTLNAHWLIDTVVSYMPQVLSVHKETKESFFVVEISLNQKQEGYFEIYHEGWVGNDYHECITVVKQSIPFIDLPTKRDEEITTYKFFLELSSLEPITFTLLLPSEH